MRLILRDAISSVIAPATTLQALDDHLAVKHPNAFWIAQNTGRTGWDGMIRFFSGTSGLFPTGLSSRVREYLDTATRNTGGYEIEDLRTKFVPPTSTLPLTLPAQPWPEQDAMIDAFLRERRGIWDSATNSGKSSVMAATLLHRLSVPALFVVPNVTLLHQTRRDMALALGEEIGILGDGDASLRRVTVACVHTIGRRMGARRIPSTLLSPEDRAAAFAREFEGREDLPAQLLPRFLALILFAIYDECHTSRMNSWWAWGKQLPAPWVLSMSGTPWTGDPVADRKIEAMSGPIIGAITNREQMLKGRSAKIHVITLANREPEGFEKEKPHTVKTELLYENRSRDRRVVRVLAELNARFGLQSVVWSEILDHVANLEKCCVDAGLKPVVIRGDVPGEERMDILGEFAAGTFDSIVCTPILRQGINLPCFDVGVPMGYNVTPVEIRQWVGRLERKKSEGRANVAFLLCPLDYTNPGLARRELQRLDILRRVDAYAFHQAETLEDVCGIVEAVTNDETETTTHDDNTRPVPSTRATSPSHLPPHAGQTPVRVPPALSDPRRTRRSGAGPVDGAVPRDRPVSPESGGQSRAVPRFPVRRFCP